MPDWGEKNNLTTGLCKPSYTAVYLALFRTCWEHLSVVRTHRRPTKLRSTVNETWLNDSTPLPHDGIDIVPSTLDIRAVFYKSIRIYLLSCKQNSTKRVPFIFVYPYCFYCTSMIAPFPLCIYPSFFLSPSYSPSLSFTPLPHIALFVISFYQCSISRTFPLYRIYRGFGNW